MNGTQIHKLVSWLQNKGFTTVGPVEFEGKLFIKELARSCELDLSGRLPFFSFKKYFIPPCEVMYRYKGGRFIEETETNKQAIFGMTVYDLKAVLLYDEVFEKDPYYQRRMQNTLIIGSAPVIAERESFDIWKKKHENDPLAYLRFDIFLIKQKSGKYNVVTGSKKGQKILDEFGCKKYEHVEFMGPLKEEGRNLKISEVVKKFPRIDSKVWKDLDKRCIACGKCAIVCPTCFCFDIIDRADLTTGEGTRQRCWTTCFDNDFSEIAGGHKFLDTVAKRIHNWYLHKFVRIPNEYGLIGCVGCGRCSKVCPANIDINQVLAKIRKCQE